MKELVEVKPNELKTIMVAAFHNRENIMVVSSPGMGKSQIGEQVARETGAHMKLWHPAIESNTDKKGLPFRASDRHAEFLPYGQLLEAMDATEPTIIIVEDFGQAPPSVQASYMQIFEAREIGGKKISDNITFFVFTNKKSDKSGVSGILEAVKSRQTTILELVIDVEAWCIWAIENGMPLELVAYIKSRPDMLHDFKPSPEIKNYPCPRTVAAVGRIMGWGLPENLMIKAIAGAAGTGFAIDFQGFLKVRHELPTMKEIKEQPSNAKVPTSPAAQYAVAKALAIRATVEDVQSVMTYLKRMAGDFQVLTVEEMTKHNPALHNTPAVTAWKVENQSKFVAAAA